MLNARVWAWQLFWCLFVASAAASWATVPALQQISVAQWRAFGVISAIAIGCGASLTTRSAFRGACAVSAGLVAGAVWLDIVIPDDVRGDRPTIAGVVRLVSEHSWEFGVALASALLGGQAMRLVQHRTTDV